MKNKIAIITHKNPDYDAICSSSSLATYLRKISNQNEVYLILEKNAIVNKLFGQIRYYSIEEVEKISFDSICVCDVNEEDRTYGVELLDRVIKSKRFLIDHHDKNRSELNINFSNRTIKPTYSSTCEMLVETLDISLLEKDTLKNLFMGILSDSSCLTRNISQNTHSMINKLGLKEEERLEAITTLCSLSEEQQQLYNQIRELDFGIEGVKAYTLFCDANVDSLIKHPKFDDLIKPTEEFPVSIFIIGVKDNYSVKLKKIENCDVDILAIATACNGGGHYNRCSGRLHGITYDELLNQLRNLLDQGKTPKKLVK